MKPQNTGKFSKKEKNIKIQIHIKYFVVKRINNKFTTKILIPAASVIANNIMMWKCNNGIAILSKYCLISIINHFTIAVRCLQITSLTELHQCNILMNKYITIQ